MRVSICAFTLSMVASLVLLSLSSSSFCLVSSLCFWSSLNCLNIGTTMRNRSYGNTFDVRQAQSSAG